MSVCHCTLGGTKACESCPNSPYHQHINRDIDPTLTGEWQDYRIKQLERELAEARARIIQLECYLNDNYELGRPT